MNKTQARQTTFTLGVIHSRNTEGGVFKTNTATAVEGQKWQDANCCQTHYKEL